HQHGVVGVVDEFVEAGDVAVPQFLKDVRFLDEALSGGDFASQLLAHDLEDDDVIGRQDLVPGDGAADIDVAHAAFAELALDAVVADDLADHFSAPSSSQYKPSLQSGMNRNLWEPMRTMSLAARSRRGSISRSL